METTEVFKNLTKYRSENNFAENNFVVDDEKNYVDRSNWLNY